ncbi:metal-dependent hydrolase [Sediminibacillus dalangtanensis]|uniref:Metal-dependent hydrolase n=1 Tax=Sediminibacillus dalangtanensis TaxID=2729421 RepID=A0ABX7VPT3_9BACI|nr:metal-dependent hydrolase [Sediminibacillus dalangtanensis]QTM97959.1 metal-dependent hydrolase [Sediminibacillus dalangtanensis]
MTGKTHIIGGIAACVVTTRFTSYDPLLLTAAGIFGALLPDICHSGSKIGRKVPLLSKLVSTLFGHRTFTHSLLFLLLIQVLFSLFHLPEEITTGVLVGATSHLLLDAATKNGIKLLYPLQMTFRLPLTVRTGGPAENGILAVLVLLVVYFGQGII